MLSYTAPRVTVQQLLQQQDVCFSKNAHAAKVFQRIKSCRTAALGYNVYQCTEDDCSHIKYQYHSCRDRHCPNCGAIKKQEWIEARTQELLPVKYYHVVFTLPHELVGSFYLNYSLMLPRKHCSLSQKIKNILEPYPASSVYCIPGVSS